MEYSFYKHLEGSGVDLGDVAYEPLRIPYTLGRRTRTYVPDFVVGRRVFEVKPERRQRGRTFDAKVTAAREWCLKNGYTYSVVDHKDFRVLTGQTASRDPHVRLAARGRRRTR